MPETRTTTCTAVLLSSVGTRRLAPGESLMRLLPVLTEQTLVSADLAVHVKLGEVAAELRLEAQARTPRIRERLAFWFARDGGWSRGIETMPPPEAARFRERLERADLVLRDVPPGQWVEALRRAFAAAGVLPPVADLPEPELRLHIGGTGWHGFTFEPGPRLLHVPSPLAPPAGDVVRLTIEPAGVAGELCCARATVVAVRRPAEATPRAPAGFTAALDAASADASVLLAARCPQPGSAPTTRVAPRYGVVGGVCLADPGEDIRYESEDAFVRDYIANLSHGGAFVRTAQVRRIGDQVVLHLRLPGRDPIGIPATVVHRGADGLGLQFELGGSVESALGAVVAELAGRPRRALIVDDDALARALLVDAFAERGYETLTASDGQAGLRAIVDELFALDAVVTDVHMPGLSGDALVSAVRQAGGEQELVLVAVSADASEELGARLRRAGADAVLSKDLGPETVVGEVDAALRRRAAGAAGAAPPPRPPPRPAVAPAERHLVGAPALGAVALAVLLAAGPAAPQGLSVSPPVLELSASQPWAELSVRNQATAPREVHASVLSWTQDDGGRIALSGPSGAYAFPEHAVLAGGEERRFRISCREPAGAEERAYRVALHVRDAGDGAAATVLVPAFFAPFEVRTSPAVRVACGSGRCRLVLENGGTVRFRPDRVAVAIVDEAGRASERHLAGWWVLAGGARGYDIPLDASAIARRIEARVDVDGERLTAAAAIGP